MNPSKSSILSALLVAGTFAVACSGRESTPGIPNLEGKILTVRGPIDPANVGQTLMHEHIFIDFKAAETAEGRSFAADSVATVEGKPEASDSSGGGGLTDYDESLAEVMLFKEAGGSTVVDVTNNGLSRNPPRLLRISEETGLNVVMGAGWYMRTLHPKDMDGRTVDDLTGILVRDITEGAQGTGIRSGIIGEVGVGAFGPRIPLTENEIKSVRASARAARLTGAPITLHSFASPDEMQRVLDIIAAEGVDLSRVVMGHVGSGDVAAMKRYTDRGAYVEFDYTGGIPGAKLDSNSLAAAAEARAQSVKNLIDAGLTDRILLAQDVCTKAQLYRNGGGGFVFTSNLLIPALKAKGVSDEIIQRIMVENPRRVLTFAAPQPLVEAAQ